MLAYPAVLDLSPSARDLLATAIRSRRKAIGSRWRKSTPGRQALVLVHLHKGSALSVGGLAEIRFLVDTPERSLAAATSPGFCLAARRPHRGAAGAPDASWSRDDVPGRNVYVAPARWPSDPGLVRAAAAAIRV